MLTTAVYSKDSTTETLVVEYKEVQVSKWIINYVIGTCADYAQKIGSAETYEQGDEALGNAIYDALHDDDQYSVTLLPADGSDKKVILTFKVY